MIKKILLLSLITLSGVFAYGQSAKQMLAEIDGHWELDDNNNVSIVKIIETPNLSKDEIFNRALNYFTYGYVYGRSTIQTQDRANGLIVGKGVFEKVYRPVIKGDIDAWHVLRVDVKEGRARVIMTLTEYEQMRSTNEGIAVSSTITRISDAYPVNPKGGQKTVMTKAFYKSYHKAFDTLDAIDKAIKDGSTSKEIENEDW